jgi:hypothetical protein
LKRRNDEKHAWHRENAGKGRQQHLTTRLRSQSMATELKPMDAMCDPKGTKVPFGSTALDESYGTGT